MARSAGMQTRDRSSVDVAPLETADEVAQLAYELFLQRGGAHGFDQQDWFEAQRIVTQRRESATGRRSRISA